MRACKVRVVAGLLILMSGIGIHNLAGYSFLQLFGSISEEDEIQVGREAAQQVERENPILRNQSVNRYVQTLGDRLARHSNRPNLRYHFKVIDKPEVNAFALPGGYVFINRGILELSENESEVAGVVAHEIAHIGERHHIEQMQKAQMLGLGLGVLDLILGGQRGTAEQIGALGGQMLAQGVFFKFSRDAEREADREGVRMLRQAGIHPEGMITLFKRMDQMRESRPALIGDFFSTHPSLSERQTNISGMLTSGDQRLTRDSNSFQNAKRSL